MTDKERVIKGLKFCYEAKDEACPRRCPFYKECINDPIMPVIRSALELLKEQPKENKHAE